MKLNADLGEHESIARTRALLRIVDLANIACGGHAGTAASMYLTVEQALAAGVRIGAHPGWRKISAAARQTLRPRRSRCCWCSKWAAFRPCAARRAHACIM